MKLNKKAEEEQKRKEAEAAKKTIHTFQGSGSSTEEESPKKHSARQVKVGGLVGRPLLKELEEMSMGGRPKDKKVFEEEVLGACRAGGIDTEKIDDSATIMGRAYPKYSGGKSCFIPVVWDTGCSKSIISEQSVRGLGIHIEELERALSIVTASGDSLSIIGVADVFIKTQVMGVQRKMLQCCVLCGHKQAPEILVSLERMKALRIIHPTFGKETIYQYLFKK